MSRPPFWPRMAASRARVLTSFLKRAPRSTGRPGRKACRESRPTTRRPTREWCGHRGRDAGLAERGLLRRGAGGRRAPGRRDHDAARHADRLPARGGLVRAHAGQHAAGRARGRAGHRADRRPGRRDRGRARPARGHLRPGQPGHPGRHRDGGPGRARRVQATWPCRTPASLPTTATAWPPRIVTDDHQPARATPAAAAKARTGTIGLAGLRGLALLSDGATRITDRYGLVGWPDLLGTIRERGPYALIAEVRAAETADADGTRWPRTKASDDATIIWWPTAG